MTAPGLGRIGIYLFGGECDGEYHALAVRTDKAGVPLPPDELEVENVEGEPLLYSDRKKVSEDTYEYHFESPRPKE